MTEANALKRFWEVRKAFLEAGAPFHRLMREVWRRMEGARVEVYDEVDLRQEFVADSKGGWLELVDFEGRPVFRFPDDLAPGFVRVYADYGEDDERPLEVRLTVDYFSDEVEVRLLWEPERERFKLLSSEVYFDLDGAPEEGALPRRIYEVFVER